MRETCSFYLGFCQDISFTLPLGRSFPCSYNSRRERAKGPIFGLNIPWILPQSQNKDYHSEIKIAHSEKRDLCQGFLSIVRKCCFFKINTHISYKMKTSTNKIVPIFWTSAFAVWKQIYTNDIKTLSVTLYSGD